MHDPKASEILAIAERHAITVEWLRKRIALANETGWMDEKGYDSFAALLDILELVRGESSPSR
jgi:hypothetical protein